MRGKHTVVVHNSRVQFTLELERNITIIRGDSATGKSTLVGMLRDYEQLGAQSGVTVSCDKECRVLAGRSWEEVLRTINDSIVFIDEGNSFVNTRDFARAIEGSSNYYVLITRESLYQLPYSVDAVLELRKSTSHMNKTYTKAYPYYKTFKIKNETLPRTELILTEDSNSGHEMFSAIAKRFGMQCRSANGKSNILPVLVREATHPTLIVADNAAFGAEMDKVYHFCIDSNERIRLYLPESFEWLLLKAGLVDDMSVPDILANPSDYIDSAQYLSWERFFTALLEHLTKEKEYMRYSKQRLKPYYLRNIDRVIRAMQNAED